MHDQESFLTFPTNIPELKQSTVVGVAIESSGHVEKEDMQTLRLDAMRRIYLLLVKADEMQQVSNILHYQLGLTWVRVDETVFTVAPQHHQYEHIGRKCAWMPEVQVDGRLIVDDVVPLPWREIFEDTRLPAKATVVVGTLSRQAQLRLPGGITGQEPAGSTMSSVRASGPSIRSRTGPVAARGGWRNNDSWSRPRAQGECGRDSCVMSPACFPQERKRVAALRPCSAST